MMREREREREVEVEVENIFIQDNSIRSKGPVLELVPI